MVVTNFLKSALLLCAFFMLNACQKASQEPVEEMQQEAQPLLTLTELLAASDIQLALSSLAEEQDRAGLREIQSILLNAAAEVNLDESELALISGDSGIIFLEFQGMRINFNRDFEKAFFSFGDIEAVYKAYPAFKELQARTTMLVENRDKLIASIQDDLEAEGTNPSASLEQARKLWLQLMQEQGVDKIVL